MSQQSSKNNNSNPDDSRTQTEETTSQMPRVSDFRVDQQGIITNVVPISMIPPTEGEIKKKKSKGLKKKKNPKKIKAHATGNDKIQEQESTNPECQTSENQESQKNSEVPHVKPFDETSTKEHQVKVAEQISPSTNEAPPSETATNISLRPQEEDPNLDQTTPSTEVPAQNVEPNVPTSGSAPIPEQEVQDQQEDQVDVDEVTLANIL
ncbi:hypothetical protein QL285_087398 [Trifolium repens]|nr:hypothetical protein QL285_087398 [Trifolium repens]